MNPFAPTYQPPKFQSKVKGFVRDNADPERRGRIRCFCPQVMGPLDLERNWLGWAEACLPWLGGLSTADFGPPLTKLQNGGEDVGVWLEFEAGHPDFPIYVGSFVVAPLPTDTRAQIDLANAPGVVGGDIIGAPPAGSDTAAINPPGPLPNEREIRLYAKKGRNILVGVEGGGSLILGPHGVSLTGVQVYANGRLITASLGDKVSG